MADKRFLTAFMMPSEWEVAGIKLKPFCLTHFLTLQVVDSPFVEDKNVKDISIEDFLIVLRICSSHSGVEALKDKPTLRERWLYYKYFIYPEDLKKDLEDFAEYIVCYTETPKIWVKEGNGNKNLEKIKEKVPNALNMCSMLLSKTNLQQDEIWRMPIGKVYWYSVGVAIIEGAEIETISTDDEDSFDSELQKLTEMQNALKEALAKTKNNNG
jgi:hypothetical protein